MQLSKLNELVGLENSIQGQLFITISLKRFNEMNFIRVDTNFFLKCFKSDWLNRKYVQLWSSVQTLSKEVSFLRI